MTPKIALVTAREALALDEDMPPLVLALREQGARVATPSWDDPAVDWSQFDKAVLRSTWDYVDRIDEFLAWADRCAEVTRLHNPPAMVRWNTDKHYLAELERKRVPVVPTRFVEPRMSAASELDRFLSGGPGAFTVGNCGDFVEYVVKPAIGAGSRDAARYTRADRGRALAHVERLLAAGRSTMLQPYLHGVDEYGETAVIYLGGSFSHAVRKGPLLRLDDDLVQGLFAPEHITPRQPDAAEHRVAAAAFGSIAHASPLYARIDLIRNERNEPVVLELELTEPSLFFLHAPDAANRFADALLAA
ncbi:MAG: hypothetical protein FIB04_08710 [Gammaproteobacteria bacterium]|nr:hypothetical protein [Gammaproteobacteria bacterium]